MTILRCPVCGQHVLMLADDMLRRHTYPTTSEQNGVVVRNACLGGRTDLNQVYRFAAVWREEQLLRGMVL